MKREINCLVCRSEGATSDYARDSNVNMEVDCPKCKRYFVSSTAIRYCLDRDDMLDDVDREKLSAYLQQDEYNPLTDTLDTKKIYEITGKDCSGKKVSK